MDLKAATAIVTGSTGRLGESIAYGLADAGCNLLCHYNTNQKAAEKLVDKIKQKGTNALAVVADLTDPDQIDSLFEKADQLRTPRIRKNGSAVFSRQPPTDVTADYARKVLDLNLIAPILTSAGFAKLINEKFPNAESPVAKIINLSDVGGLRPWSQYVVYCCSKAGLIGATKAMAKELAPAVCVNAIALGLINWPENFTEAEKKRQLSFIPAARLGTPAEVANAIISLIENDYITGQVLCVDGGRCI